jgi:hypothetical protein
MLNREKHHDLNFKEENENMNEVHYGCLLLKLYSRIFSQNRGKPQTLRIDSTSWNLNHVPSEMKLGDTGKLKSAKFKSWLENIALHGIFL